MPLFQIVLTLCAVLAGSSALADPVQPPIASFLKPTVYQRALENREVMTHASLDDADHGLEHYHFYATALVHASLAKTHAAIVNYSLYAKMIPYIQRSDYDPKTKLLEIEGGIWKFMVRSELQMEEKSDSWIHFRIVKGHFQGLEGDFLFEPIEGKNGDISTLVLLKGDQTAKEFPPRLVIEQGAEIVFGFTCQHMRSYVEKGNSP